MPTAWDTILWQLRLPRVLLAGIVGGALPCRARPTKDCSRTRWPTPTWWGGFRRRAGRDHRAADWRAAGDRRVQLPAHAAFAGGISAVAVAYSIAPQLQGTPLTTLILAGVAIASLAGAVTSLIMLRSDPELRPVLSWLLGSFIAAEWSESGVVLLYLAPCLAVLLGFARILNVLQLSEEHAAMLGIEVEKVKLLLILAATLATAAAVSFAGLIGFVGLIAPMRCGWSGAPTIASSCPCRPSWGPRS